jgi:acetyl-CoA C-acetyltransferase
MRLMPHAVILSAVRSPISRAGTGALRTLDPAVLAARMVRAALNRVPNLDPQTIDHLYVGSAQAPDGFASDRARRVAVRLGLHLVPAVTLSRFCTSSLHAIRLAARGVECGAGHVYVAAGVESASRFDRGDLHCQYAGLGLFAEEIARVHRISRSEQDEYGVRSHVLAGRSRTAGFAAREITPVALPDGRVVTSDDGPRFAGHDLVRGLRPLFLPTGTVTAGNSSPLGDGAAALVVTSVERAASLGVTPLARIVAAGVSGYAPAVAGDGTAEAVGRTLEGAGLTAADIDLFELNESFAAEVIATCRMLGIDAGRVNVHGGSIALGQPFGMTGARMMTTLLNGLAAIDGRYGLAAACAAGGQGAALVVERLS